MHRSAKLKSGNLKMKSQLTSRSKASPWVQRYKWPIFFFGAVALVSFVLGLKPGNSFSKIDDGFDPTERDTSMNPGRDAETEQRDTPTGKQKKLSRQTSI